MLSRLFRKSSVKRAARLLYDELSNAARAPYLYGQGRVPDTPDGRFELLALHAAVFFARLSKRGDQAEETSQEVFDILFSAMDHALRELGVGDISVGKRIRKLAESFYGRMAVYHEALAGAADTYPSLVSAISTNVLETPDEHHPFADQLAQRARNWSLALAAQSDDAILSGQLAKAT